VKLLIQQAEDLKQALLDFALESEDDLATALNDYSAAEMARLSKSQQNSQSFVLQSFLVEGRIRD
jgi:hypothetical protein